MALTALICDDSLLGRNQLKKSLSPGWRFFSAVSAVLFYRAQYFAVRPAGF